MLWSLLLLCALPAWAARPFRGGAVASAHSAASEAALQMLEKGGTAADAAVAAAFVLAVVGPYHSGLGGGGFALLHDAKSGESTALDFREVAPQKASRDMFVRDGAAVAELSQDGGLSVAVPGAVRGYLELHERAGRLPRRVVLAPAIRLAREGFRVTPKYLQLAEERADCLRKHAEAARLFLVPGKDGAAQVPPVGHLVRQPELARTLQGLVDRGAAAFYGGRVAQALAQSVQEAGGVLTEEDLSRYRTRPATPLAGSFRGHRVLTMPPPSAGGVALLQVLGVLEQAYPERVPWREPRALHVYIEALRRAYVDRVKYLGDPAFVDVPLARITSREHLGAMLASIDRERATPSAALLPPRTAGPATSQPERKNTTHVSVVDAAGNAVALTTTVNYAFGSCVVAKGTGVLLNDEMDDFAAVPGVPNVYGLVTGEANAVAPGKVPLSSMTPTLVFQKEDPKRVLLAVGSPGGSTIPTTVAQVVLNVVDHGMDVVRAVGQGRVHHQYLPDEVRVDTWGLEPSTAAALERMGHRLKRTEAWGDAEAVRVDPRTGLRTAGSDPRNEGWATGQD
ncbi:MAG: gamma-glutamyltransferase [Myxococcaceae bacterium]|nr:gamma-glutamyltransferase [Myxococcaceae bacterium]